jgi:amino acid adenylation domain-containing protein
MTVAIELLNALRAKDVSLWADDDQLAYDAPMGALTEDDLAAIRSHKPEILKLLAEPVLGVAPPIERADHSEPLPLSLAQQRLWFIDRLEGAAAAYNIQGAFRLSGELDRDALAAALDAIISRHDALRTAFRSSDGTAVQVIEARVLWSLHEADVFGLPAAERNDAVQEHAAREAHTRFDLAETPLFRVLLVSVLPHEHVLLVTMHHIVSDGWSLGVFAQELAALYAAHRRGGGDPLPPLAVQYADYAQWQRRWLGGSTLQQQRDYWSRQLAGVPALLDLPTDRPRPAVQSYAGASVALTFSPELTAGLKTLGRNHGVTLFMTLLAGWSILLSRLSRQSDVVVGVPVSNRPRTELERLIGLFVNTLALRTRVDDDPTVATVLRCVKEVTLDAHANQDLPFAEVVEALRPARSLSYSPLFQTLFVLQNASQLQVAIDDGPTLQPTGEYIAGGIDTARFDLTLSLEESGNTIAGALNYASDLFDRATVDRWIEHFKTLLAVMVTAPATTVSSLPLLDPRERQVIVDDFNATHVDYGPPALVHELFQAQAAATPLAQAVEFDGRHLTYAELNRRANQLARHLIARGVGPDRLVGVFVERSVEMVVTLLGILKAGGAYVPLDPAYPRERLAFMLADAAMPVLLTQQHLIPQLPPTSAEVFALDARHSEIARYDEGNLEGGEQTPRNLAYVIYTSGSTGQPKGAMNEHRAVSNRLQWMQDRYRLGATDAVLQKTPLSFDVSVWEVFWPLLTGARLIVARPGGHHDPRYLSHIIREARVTTLHFVPSMLQAFVDDATAAECTSIRHIVCSGEELSVALQDQCLGVLPHAALHNLYGPTEAAVDVTYWDCQPNARLGRVPIGYPIANTRMYILDGSRQPVPIGVPGEIHVGGIAVGRGYWNRPDLTAERFVADSFRGHSDAPLYKTGDLGRWRADGAIEYLGRNDNQVKVRGFRIELGEIEAVLRRHAAVNDAAVVVRDDGAAAKQLVAYVTCRGEAPAAKTLRAFAAEQLPEYMVPSAFVVVEALPLMPNGKLDRQALPRPDFTPRENEYVAPRNGVEQTLSAIWSEVIRLPRVGIDDEFFAAGGDSILSIRVVEKARTAGLAITVEDIFRYPTVARLAQVIHDRHTAAPANLPREPFALLSAQERAAFESRPEIEDAYPLSALQAGMYFHSELHRDSGVYHDIFSLSIGGTFDVALFEQALHALVERHPILRSSFHTSADNRLVQAVHKRAELPLEVHDISGLGETEQEQFVERWMEEEKWRRFTWSEAPLFRIVVHRRAANRFQHTLSFHHAILDGWSLASLQTELFEHYLSLQAGKEIAMTAPKSLYRDYIALEQQALQSEEAQEFWRQLLDDAVRLRLPNPEKARAHQKGIQIMTCDATIEEGLYGRLKERARELNVPLKTLLFGAHLKVMALVSGQPDVLTGLVSNGRVEEEDGDRALGLYLNSLPFRMKLQDGAWRALINAVHRLEQAAMPYRRYPLQAVQQLVGGEPLLNTLFNYVHFHVYQRLFDAGMVKVPNSRVFEQTNFDLMVVFSQALTGEGLSLSLAYDPAALDDDQVARLSVYYRRALQEIADDVDGRHSRATLLSQAELDSQRQWNDTAVAWRGSRLMHRLVEEQVGKTPSAVALIVGKESLTYEELNRRSNQLAQHLRAHGVGPDTRVAISLERGVDMVVAMLGTLKAGGAYVPVDPEYPAVRLAYILADSAPRVVLTERKFASRLPGAPADIIALDEVWPRIAALDPAFEPAPVAPEDVAYVIYTSGSTGRPKGVMIEHRNAANFIEWGRTAFSPEQLAQTVFSTSINFDLSVFELFVTLSCGGTVFLVENLLHVDGSSGPTLINTVPSALDALLAAGRVPPSVRVVNLAGEPLGRELVERVFARTGAEIVANLYGPTETTTYSTYAVFSRAAAVPEPHIGRPVANTFIRILDEHGELVPNGVAGEISIGGAGVARGYLNRPELTRERFVADPFSDDPGARMYRTGDLGRWRSDGTIEYLGRNDHQVKVRGFRIELGEIETELRAHSQVREAVVIARDSAQLGRHLVAYVSPADDRELATPEERGQVAAWQHVFDQEYIAPAAGADPRDNFSVWISSYDGQPLGLDAMRAWADLAVSRMVRLPTRRVLEIGCGVGLLLFRLLPHCGRYVGTDFSQAALDTIAKSLPPDERGRVELLCADALDTAALGDRLFDTTAINSVIQYFPSVDYLLTVLDDAIGRTAAGGAVFIGDVRNYDLLGAFATAVVLHKAARHEPLAAARQRIRAQVHNEGELLVAPELFASLAERFPRVSHIEILPKIAAAHANELFDFRYDVVLHVEGAWEPQPLVSLDWQRDALSLPSLADRLEGDRPDYLRVASIPSDRLGTALRMQALALDPAGELESVGDVFEAIERERPGRRMSPDPRELVSLASQLGYEVDLSFVSASAPGEYGIVLTRRGLPRYVAPIEPRRVSPSALRALANSPLRNRLTAQLTAALKEHVGGRLPEHMHPSSYVVLDSLPLTPNGKFDRKALEALDTASSQTDRAESQQGESDAPQGPMEIALAGIWRDLLGIERVGRNDSFFDLGGHSLLALQVTYRLYALLGWDVEVATLFDYPTLAVLARQIETGGAATRAPIEIADRDQPLALSPAQRRLFRLARRAHGVAAYQVPQAVRFRGPLDIPALQRALDTIVERHEVLRTTYVDDGGVPVQQIAPEAPFLLRILDVSGLPDDEREAAIAREAAEEAGTPFDLGAGPVIRGRLIRVSHDEHVFLFTAHSIVYDGWSRGVLLRELGMLYAAYREGAPNPLPPLPIQYADYAQWQNEWLSKVIDSGLDFWLQHLAGAPPLLELATDRPRPAVQSYAGAGTTFVLDEELTAGLRSLTARHDATLFMTLFTGWAILMSKLSGQPDVVIGALVANREVKEIESMIGSFINYLPLRVQLYNDPNVSELLYDVKQMAKEAYAHQWVPFVDVAEVAQPLPDPAFHPLFQVSIMLENTPRSPLQLPDISFSPQEIPFASAELDLALSLKERADTIDGLLVYASPLFEAETIDRWIASFKAVLRQMVRDTACRMNALPLAGAIDAVGAADV